MLLILIIQGTSQANKFVPRTSQAIYELNYTSIDVSKRKEAYTSLEKFSLSEKAHQ